MKLFKHLFALACLVVAALPAMADNTLSIEPVNIDDNEVVNIPVYMTNSDPILTLQFDVTLPEFLEFAGEPIKNSDRFNNGQSINFTGHRVLVSAMNYLRPFKGNEGEIMTLPVKVKEGTPAGSVGDIVIENIVLAGPAEGLNSAPAYYQNDFNVTASYKVVAPEISFSAQPATLVVNPGSTAKLDVTYESNVDILGLQMTFHLPEGLTIPLDYDPVVNTAVSPNGYLSVTPRAGNAYCMILVDPKNTPLPIGGNSLFTVDIVASDTFEAETAEITVDECIVSLTGNIGHHVDGFSVAVENHAQAYARLNDLLGVAESTLADALEVIKTECPDVADQFTGEAISAKISELRNKVDEAYAAGTLAANEAELQAEIEALGTEIETMITDAYTAEREFKAKQANDQAYAQMQEGIATARTSLADTMAAIAEDCPDVAANFSDAEIAEMIDNLAAAVEGYNEEGTCAYMLDEFNEKLQEIAEALEALHTAAVIAEEQYKSDKAAAEEAHERLNEQLETAENTLSQALEVIAEECPDVKDQFNGAEIAAAIAELRSKVEEAYANGTIVADEEQLSEQIQAIGTEIETMITDAYTAEREYKAKQANDQAYAQMQEGIATARTSLADTMAAIAEDCPDVAANFSDAEIAEMIDNLAAAVEGYNEEGTCAYMLDEFNEKLQEIAEALEALHTAAVTAEEQYKSDKAAAEEAHERLNEQLETAENTLSQALEVIAEECPDVKDQFNGAEIAAAIAELRSKVEEAYANGTIVADEEQLSEQIQAIGTEIETMLTDAYTAEREYKAKQANDQAYAQMQEGIATARTSLADTMAAIAEDCPDVAANFSDAEIAEMIDNLAAAVEGYNEEGTCAYMLDEFNEKLQEIAEALEALHSAAVAAEEQYKSDKVAANEAAHDSLTAKLDEARAALQAAKDEIAESCPAVSDQYTGEEYGTELDNIAAEIESLYEQGLCVANEKPITDNIDAIIADINAYVDQAKAAQAQAELEARNQAAYDEVIDSINALQDQLNATIERVQELYPEAPVQSYIYVAQNAIDNARNGADAALDAANGNGTEFDYTFDADTIAKLIKEIEDAAQMLGIKEIFGDNVNADAVCDIYTSDGRQVASRVPASEVRQKLTAGLYIIVTEGHAFKFAVK